MTNNFLTKLKQLFTSKIFIAVFCLLAGIAATLTAQSIADGSEKLLIKKVLAGKNLTHQDVEDFYAGRDFDNFFSSDGDISKEMNEVQKKMNKVFAANRKQIEQALKVMQKNNDGELLQASRTSVATKEDEKDYYYELYFSGFKKDEIAVTVKDNVLTFAASSKKANDQKNYAQSSFNYAFSIPDYDHKKQPEIIKQDDRITVKFAKKNK